jgi:hypothetical protein
MKTLGLITPNHKNRKVLALWLAQIKRLRIELDTYVPAVVVSDEGDKSLCGRYGVWHITHNTAKGEASMKWNTAMGYMRSIGADAVTITGSDDVISTDFYRKTLEQVELGIDLIGVTNAYFYCGQGLDRGKLVRFEGRRMLGIGKTVSSRVLDLADWNLWRVKKDWGMDAMAQQEIDKHSPTIAYINEIIVDVKTRDNLNSFNVFKRRPQVDSSLFFNILSDEELKILKAL